MYFMRWETNINLNKNELQNARLQNLTGHPSNPVAGQFYYNTTDNIAYIYNGYDWKNMINMSVDEIVNLINSSLLKIDDDNLSDNVNDAITKKHAHSNKAVLDAIEQAFTTALKTKLDGIATGATKVENSATNGNIKINGAEQVVYTHPANHPATVITEDSTHRFITDTERTNWNDANSKKHIQNTDNTLTNAGANTVKNTTASGNILDFQSGTTPTTKSSIDVNGNFTGNSATATKLQTARTISITGDMTGSASFDGTGNPNIVVTQKNSGVTAGTYTKVTVDAKGNVTSGVNLSASDIPTIDHNKISDFDAGVRTNTLNEMAVPTADLNLNNKKITNLADPVNAKDAVTKDYADSLRAGLSIKDPVRVATTTNITLSGTQTIDGVAVVVGDRVLVKNQTTASQNGIYIVASSTWTRASDADDSPTSEVNAGMAVWVNEGTTNGDSRWVLTTNNPITLGTTSLTFTKDFQGSDLVAGTGLTKSGNTLSLATAGTAGTYTKVTTDSLGRVTGGTTLSASDIPNLDFSKITTGRPSTLAGYGIGDGVNISEVATTPTANKLLKLDANSKLPASITGNADGNAGTATKLQTARRINGVLFDGQTDITITADPNVHNHDDRYYTETEADARFAPKSHVGSGGTSHANATTTVDGFMSSTDKVKLDGVSAGATKVESSATNGNIKINGVEQVVYTHPTGTNPHGVTKADVGLGNVDNIQQATKTEFNTHNTDNTRHITSAERTAWNNKQNNLGFTPIKDGGSTPEFRSGLESARPTATGSNITYFCTDTGKIYKDISSGVWKQMGGQDLQIASKSTLGGIKVGANLTITEDGILNANDNPASFIRKQEKFIKENNQTTFVLTEGSYKPNTQAITIYINGAKQSDKIINEISSTSFGLPSNIPNGSVILCEYLEVLNMNPFAYHAKEHLTGGVDAIPKATTTADGLMPKEDFTKLSGIATGATKVENSVTNGNIKINGVEQVVYTHPTGTNPHGTTKSDVGLGNVENKSSATIRSEITSGNVTTALGYVPTRKYSANLGNNTATEFTITHNLATKDLTVSIEEVATGEIIMADIFKTDVNNVKILFGRPPTLNQFRATITG